MNADVVHDTKNRLIEVAERLFAERGVADASLREITREAGVNLAAVNYHFGSKLGLLEAVLRERGAPLAAERQRLLDAAVAAAAPELPTLRSILEAFIAPVFALKGRSPHFARVLARVQMEGLVPELEGVFQEMFSTSFQLFHSTLSRALPQLPGDEVRWRLFFTVGTFHFVVCSADTIRAVHGEDALDEGHVVDRIVSFCEAGLAAPLPASVAVTHEEKSP